MALDHGTLNIPLSKRGDINAQLDRHNAAQAREMKTARKATAATLKANQKRAKELFDAMTPERLWELAEHTSQFAYDVKQKLKRDCFWQPELVIALLSPKSA